MQDNFGRGLASADTYYSGLGCGVANGKGFSTYSGYGDGCGQEGMWEHGRVDLSGGNGTRSGEGYGYGTGSTAGCYADYGSGYGACDGSQGGHGCGSGFGSAKGQRSAWGLGAGELALPAEKTRAMESQWLSNEDV